MKKLFSRVSEASSERNYMGIPSQALDGYLFSIKSVEEKVFDCPKDCINIEIRTEKGKTDCYDNCCPVVNGRFSAIAICFNIIASDRSDGKWMVARRDVKIVDDDGFVYEGCLLCDKFDDRGVRPRENDYIRKRTQANVVYIFRPLPKGKLISAILVFCNI